MSLHNSTIIENRNGLFYLVDLIGIEREAFTAFLTNSKPSASGFEFERRNSGAERSFRRQPKAGDGNGE